MTSPNTNFAGDLLAVTMQELEDELFNQILLKNATTAMCKEYGMVEPKPGGPKIAIPIEYAENGSYMRYSGPQALNTLSNEVFSVYEYEWKQVAINIQAHGRELLQNMGPGQVRDLLKARVKNAKTSFENNFNEDILSDGTSDGGLQVGGLQLLIADAGTGTVGGISRSSFSFAKNQFYRCTTDGGAAVSAANIVPYMDEVDLLVGAYRGKTKVILADGIMYKFYEQAVHPLQRLNRPDAPMAKLGFRSYAYKDSELVYEPTLAGMPSATQYWLDPEAIALCPHKERNLVRLPKRESFNQDAQIEYMAWMGNLVGKNFRKLGVLNND